MTVAGIARESFVYVFLLPTVYTSGQEALLHSAELAYGQLLYSQNFILNWLQDVLRCPERGHGEACYASGSQWFVPRNEPPRKIGKEVIDMLYFVKSELRGAPPLPLEQWLDLLVKQFEIQASYQKEGKILAQGVYAGRKGCCCIYDVESNEVLHRLIGRLPAHAFLDWEVIPLFSHEQQLEVAKEHLASMRESKK